MEFHFCAVAKKTLCSQSWVWQERLHNTYLSSYSIICKGDWYTTTHMWYYFKSGILALCEMIYLYLFIYN